MSMSDCIEGIDITDEDRLALQNSLDRKGTLDQMELRVKRKQKHVRMQKLKHNELISRIQGHEVGEVSGLRGILTGDVTGLSKGSNIEYRTHAIAGMAQSKMLPVMQELSTIRFGLKRKNVALADDMIREIMGTNTGNKKAQDFGRMWGGVSEDLRVRFNDAGGAIGKLDTWGMPQSHSQVKVAQAGEEAWIKAIRPLLNDVEDLDLSAIYETISTGGANKLMDKKPTFTMGGGKMLANSNAEKRTLHFKDGDSWLQYNKQFGNSNDPLAVFQDHIRTMSTDIANLEILGPNPEAMYRTLQGEVLNKQNLSSEEQQGFAWYTDALFKVVSGHTDMNAALTKGGQAWAERAGTVRAWQTATKLGSAMLSAVTDVGTLMVNTKYQGMSATKMIKTMFKNFDIDNQVAVSRLGFAADVFNSTISQRYSELGAGAGAYASEAVIRASGMSIWTEAARKAFQYEFYNHLSDMVRTAQKTGDIPSQLLDYGLDAKSLKNFDLDNLDTMQQTRFLEIINQETDYAVMMPTARTRAITTGGGAAKGTGIGEVSRLAFQFKSFPITFMIQQGGRVFSQKTGGNKFVYGTALLASTSMLGALAVMAKDAAKGYTPRDGSPLSDKQGKEDMTKFWSAAIVQGGGIGIIGDLLFSDQNRFGGGPAETVVGPGFGTAVKALKLGVGNAQQALAGDDTNIGSEAVDFVNREMNPLNLWYSKAVIEKYVVDELKMLFDPNYKRAKARKERKRKRDYGQTKFI